MKDANEHEIRAWLAEREPAMLALLAELVNRGLVADCTRDPKKAYDRRLKR